MSQECLDIICEDGTPVLLNQAWCPITKKGGIKGLLILKCEVQLPNDQAVLDLLAGNAVEYIDNTDPANPVTATATLAQLVALGLAGTAFKKAYGSLGDPTINSSVGACGKQVIDSTVWPFSIRSKAFDKSPAMVDLILFNDLLKNFDTYHKFFVTCADKDKATYISPDDGELVGITYTVPEDNKENQVKGIDFNLTLAGACAPMPLPFDAYNTINVF